MSRNERNQRIQKKDRTLIQEGNEAMKQVKVDICDVCNLGGRHR